MDVFTTEFRSSSSRFEFYLFFTVYFPRELSFFLQNNSRINLFMGKM